MLNYDKDSIKKQLTIDDYFELLSEFNGNPTKMGGKIISDTICHNPACEGSHKLYFYPNDDGMSLFMCYTGGCENSSFDIFELTQKVARIQWKKEFDLNDSVRYIADKFHLTGEYIEDFEDGGADWKILDNYSRIKEVKESENEKLDVVLKEYDSSILNLFNYNVKIRPWIDDGISEEVLSKARIGYAPAANQITIPHFDQNNRFIGLRGRSLSAQDAEQFGKYRPMRILNQQFNHPLGFNLYGFNWTQDNIKTMKKAIIFESEKSVLRYSSEFGWNNNISVACCGSNISNYQIQLLMDCGVEEIIIALDRQFQKIGDKEYEKLVKHLIKIDEKYKSYVKISFIFDKDMITGYKASPIDESREKFLQLFKERVNI